MQIALLAPIVESIPPKKYGGIERDVYDLAEKWTAMGHQVTLFASGDSQTSAKLVSVTPISLREAKVKKIYGLNTWTELNIVNAFQRQSEFDVISDHTGQDRGGHLAFVIAQFVNTPTVVTLHNPVTKTKKPLFAALSRPFIVTVSKSQMPKSLRKLPNYLGAVYNGMEMTNYPFSPTNQGYLAFVGRMSRKKGLDIAIRVAKKLKLPLLIAAKLDPSFSDDMKYFNNSIKPFLGGEIKWVGEVDEKKRNEILSQALCLLHPAAWREPFGRNLVEAMGCGAPVIAFNRGAIPEIIEDGKNGFIVENEAEMVQAVKKVSSLDRKKIREYALKNFNAQKMAEDYIQVFEKAIKQFKPL